MIKIIAAYFIVVISNYVFAQDSHYWNIQYGAKSTLLGGSVIGSVTDLSATYYNPGAISLFKDPKIILSAKVYQYENIRVVNGAGENKDLDYSSITPAPTFVAFKINIDTTGRNKLAFNVLTRQSMNFDLDKKATGNNNSPEQGGIFEAGEVSLQQKFNEIWAGASFSRRINDYIGLGVTAYVAYRNQTTEFQTIIENLDSVNQISSYLGFRKLNFNNYRALLKAGIIFNLNPVTFGLTVTTPSLNMFGSGSYTYYNFLNEADSPDQNLYQANFQDDLDAKYKTSWAAGFGAAYWGEKVSIHFSSEWYNAVLKYQPINLKPLNSQSTGETFTKEITQQLKSVINAGIGLEYKLNDKLSFAGSFITDYSAYDPNSESHFSISKWDIYHISAGTYFSLGASQITLGFSYSFGSDSIKQIADLSNPDANIGGTVKSNAEVKYRQFQILFGFIF